MFNKIKINIIIWYTECTQIKRRKILEKLQMKRITSHIELMKLMKLLNI